MRFVSLLPISSSYLSCKENTCTDPKSSGTAQQARAQSLLWLHQKCKELFNTQQLDKSLGEYQCKFIVIFTELIDYYNSSQILQHLPSDQNLIIAIVDGLKETCKNEAMSHRLNEILTQDSLYDAQKQKVKKLLRSNSWLESGGGGNELLLGRWSQRNVDTFSRPLQRLNKVRQC